MAATSCRPEPLRPHQRPITLVERIPGEPIAILVEPARIAPAKRRNAGATDIELHRDHEVVPVLIPRKNPARYVILV
jgi:hypothetical protein